MPDIGYRVAGFISEWWPTSNRNAGRLRVGMGGRLPSESAVFDDHTVLEAIFPGLTVLPCLGRPTLVDLSTGTEVSAIVGIENSLIGGRVVVR